MGLVPGQGVKIPHACGQEGKKKKKKKQSTNNRSNSVTNSIKTFKKWSTSQKKKTFKKRICYKRPERLSEEKNKYSYSNYSQVIHFHVIEARGFSY